MALAFATGVRGHMLSLMRRLYRRWMHDWETRLTTRDTNRAVRPFELGLECMRRWPLPQRLHVNPIQQQEEAICQVAERSAEVAAR